MRALILCAAALPALHGEDRASAARAMEEAATQQRAAGEVQKRAAGTQPRPATLTPPELPLSCARLPEADARTIVAKAAAREGLAPGLLRAVIERESGFRPCAVSPKGAQGLMQLMPATASQLGVKDAFDPAENAGSGARFLARLLSRYGGDLELALGAYNAGPARVDNEGGVPDIPETRDYVRAILGSLGLR